MNGTRPSGWRCKPFGQAQGFPLHPSRLRRRGFLPQTAAGRTEQCGPQRREECSNGASDSEEHGCSSAAGDRMS
ncbi:MAG: hypothetical protein ACRCUT_15345, partial [Spirochaetota bacterium]